MPRWTPEARKKQRDWILKHKPWLKSTGPKTEKGMAIASQNARKYPPGEAPADLRKALQKVNSELKKCLQGQSRPEDVHDRLDHFSKLIDRQIETLEKEEKEWSDRIRSCPLEYF